MEKINKFLEYFIENIDDERITIYKKMKYGHRYYYVNFSIDEDPIKGQTSLFQYRDNMEIIFDNRNECIEFFGGDEIYPLILEDKELLKKWNPILESIVSNNIENRIVDIFEKTLNSCYNKNLYRELQMKKLFKEDESI
jgi:hypothetical protein